MTESVSPQKMPYVMDIEPGSYAWCRCGRSAKQPFCDGSHASTGILPEVVQIEQKRKVAWCGCKRSAKAPFCDGSHSRL